MICTQGALVTSVVRAHYVDKGRVLSAHTYMDLRYHPGSPLEARLSGRGLGAGERVFSRDLLAAALAGRAPGPGSIQFRLLVPPPLDNPALLVSLDDGRQEYAFTRPAKVQAFLRQTHDLVPPKEDKEEELSLPLVDAAIAALLGRP